MRSNCVQQIYYLLSITSHDFISGICFPARKEGQERQPHAGSIDLLVYPCGRTAVLWSAQQLIQTFSTPLVHLYKRQGKPTGTEAKSCCSITDMESLQSCDSNGQAQQAGNMSPWPSLLLCNWSKWWMNDQWGLWNRFSYNLLTKLLYQVCCIPQKVIWNMDFIWSNSWPTTTHTHHNIWKEVLISSFQWHHSHVQEFTARNLWYSRISLSLPLSPPMSLNFWSHSAIFPSYRVSLLFDLIRYAFYSRGLAMNNIGRVTGKLLNVKVKMHQQLDWKERETFVEL